jgi:hypothetical protein
MADTSIERQLIAIAPLFFVKALRLIGLCLFKKAGT